MTSNTRSGTIEKTVLKKMCEETHIEWKIPNFSTTAELEGADQYIYFRSPAFSFNDISCFLCLFLKSDRNNEFMSLYLNATVKKEYIPEYNISLRKLNGSMEYLTSGILRNEIALWWDMGDIIKRSELLRRKSELAPQNALTIICTLTYKITHSTEPAASDLTIPLKLIRLDTLSENFKDLFDNKETCDTTLKVKDKEYKAHRSVLIARSSVFAATFKHDTLEKQTGVITIPDCDPDSFQEFLEYLYCGRLEELTCRSALNLYYTSDKYDVQELKTFCTKYLVQSLTVEDVCEVAVFSDKYDEAELSSAVQDFFNTNVHEIVDTSGWDDLLTRNRRLANKLLKGMSRAK